MEGSYSSGYSAQDCGAYAIVPGSTLSISRAGEAEEAAISFGKVPGRRRWHYAHPDRDVEGVVASCDLKFSASDSDVEPMVTPSWKLSSDLFSCLFSQVILLHSVPVQDAARRLALQSRTPPKADSCTRLLICVLLSALRNSSSGISLPNRPRLIGALPAADCPRPLHPFQI